MMVVQVKVLVNNLLCRKVMENRPSLPTNIPIKPNFRQYYQNFKAYSKLLE